MTRAALFGLAALIPAALSPGVAQSRMLSAMLCSGNGAAQTVTIPLAPLPPRGDDGCCAKGCHAGSSRKRTSCHI